MICHKNLPVSTTITNKVTFSQKFQFDQVSNGRRPFSKTIAK